MDFVLSERKDDIYYGDIFKICNQGCLIFGHGKTKACRKCIEFDEDEIALDFACLTSDDKNIYGHFDIGMMAEGVEDSINERIPIKFLLRMLSEEETVSFSIDAPVMIELDTFVTLCEFNINYQVKQTIEDRKERFKKLTKNKKLYCYLVPYCTTVEHKAKFVKDLVRQKIVLENNQK